jgi:hypothetical protein
LGEEGSGSFAYGEGEAVAWGFGFECVLSTLYELDLLSDSVYPMASRLSQNYSSIIWNQVLISSIARESGVDESVTRKFPGSTVTYGSAASGAGDNRKIPLEEGGDIDRATGQYVASISQLL